MGGWADCRHWISRILRAALELGLGWGWQVVEGEAGCPSCAYRTEAALGSLRAHPWLVGPCSTLGSLIGRRSLGMGRTRTETDNQVCVVASRERSGEEGQ